MKVEFPRQEAMRDRLANGRAGRALIERLMGERISRNHSVVPERHESKEARGQA